MSFKIICPYCFKEMEDHDVHFRSELVNSGENDILPIEYQDFDEFDSIYMGEDKEEIKERYRQWEFFVAHEDAKYKEFWAPYDGTTEYSAADEKYYGVQPYLRTVIEPNLPYHQEYLKKQEEDYFIRDPQGMVSSVQLVSGEICDRRVCCYCHNPLPTDYGKYPVKFTSIIGITGSGKTVYLWQLLKRINRYAAKVAMASKVTTTSVKNFLDNNVVAAGKLLPGSTPAKHFQQPLFFELTKDNGPQGKITEILVMYDVAGEVFENSNTVNNFAKFIKHADGIIMLIDPMQFDIMVDMSANSVKSSEDPAKALNTIQSIISKGNLNEKIAIPVAVCISKSDQEEVLQALEDQELIDRLLEDVHEVEDSSGESCACFNAKEYREIGKKLRKFMQQSAPDLYMTMKNSYINYSYFAFTALGCEVEDGKPKGPVLPKRIEEPLLWMFHKFGYIDKNDTLPWETNCPYCNGNKIKELHDDERVVVIREGRFIKRKVRYTFDYQCQDCGEYFNKTNNDIQ